MQVEQTQTQLKDKQAEIMRRVDAIQKDLQKAHSADSSEQAQERENDEVLESLLNEAKIELKQINTALQRIEAGDYGVCSWCGEDIAEKRLEAYPEADKCINCAA